MARASRIVYMGQEVHLRHALTVPTECTLLIRFESTNSPWKQGLRIGDMKRKTTLRLTVADQTAPGMFLWTDTCPPEVKVTVKAPDGRLFVYNMWDTGDGRCQSLLYGAGMLVEMIEPNGWRYRCNDGHEEVTFQHVVFSLTVLDHH